MCKIALSKKTRKVKKNGSLTDFLVERLRNFSHYSHYCKNKIEKYLHSTFGNSNFTHLTTDVMFSGQRFPILAIFSGGRMTFFAKRLRDFFVERSHDFLCEEVA